MQQKPKMLKSSMKKRAKNKLMHAQLSKKINAGAVNLALAFLILIHASLFAQQVQPVPILDPGNIARYPLFQQMPLIQQEMPMVTIAAVGDLMMSSWIIDYVNEMGVDYPFDSTRTILASADIAIANLEAPLTAEGERFEDKKYTFKVPPHFVEGIAGAGFDVVTMANNHIVDYGCQGVMSTIDILNGAGIKSCGAGENRRQACSPTFIDVNNVRIAFVGFSMTFPDEFWATADTCGTCYPTEDLLARVISECERQADFTVASFHWGAEKHTEPRQYQINFGRRAIDFGADLVLGHHPHVLQGLELYKNKLIAYSLGNYVFASYSNVARTSLILKTKIDADGLILAKLIPINVHNASINFQPNLLKGRAKRAVLDELNMLSTNLNDGKTIIDSDGYILPSTVLGSTEHLAAD